MSRSAAEDSPAQAAYRDGLRAWLAEHLPARPSFPLPMSFLDVETVEQTEYLRRWQRALYDAGYVGVEVPKELGGQGGEPWQQTIVNQELVLAKAPPLINVIGLRMAMPTILVHGTDEQKRRFVPGILSSDEIWCQGFSEPNAGSDLASLKTTAVRRGDRWVVNGHKIWTTQGQVAKYMILVARTDKDAPKHAGLSYFLMPMQQPGVTVRPLVKMTREASFNQVILDDAEVPLDGLLGELGQGWQVAMTTLLYERGGAGSGERAAHTALERVLARMVRLARRSVRGGRPAIEDPVIRDRLAGLAAEIEAVRQNGQRGRIDELQDWPMGLALMSKLALSELHMRCEELAQDILGPAALQGVGSPSAPDGGDWGLAFMNGYGPIIGGGTSEIQKNVIGERVLGLAKG